MNMGILAWIICLLVGLLIVAILTVRLWPLDVSTIETDAFSATALETPNYFINSDEEGGFNLDADELAQGIQTIIMATPRMKQVSITADGRNQTYVARSAVFGFPDFISVSIKGNSDGSSSVKLFSRSRFGYSDLGVNKRRVLGWLADIRADLGT